MNRPLAPELPLATSGFAPDQDGLGAWARATFIEEGGALSNPAHEHLRSAAIGWLWTNADNAKQGRTIVGECKMVPPLQSNWSSARSQWQLLEWFGDVPDFLITVSAPYATFADDPSFCALIEHELYHAAQKTDQFGMPMFSRDTGRPIYAMRGHCVEEFVGVVERYGAAATGTAAMVEAANSGPTIGLASIGGACGTCMRKAA